MDSKLLSGTLDMMILDVVARGPTYGYQMAQTVLLKSDGALELKEGSLYPALHRLERQGMLASHWVDTEDGRRRKYYKITAAGVKALAVKRAEWLRFTRGVDGALGGANEWIVESG
ncbi:MAG TPA: PadR family transcriptional regulator [Sumerlaeia bacterium]|nr:PadR family transcriptional regulator [Sumerlaeia bacterium]